VFDGCCHQPQVIKKQGEKQDLIGDSRFLRALPLAPNGRAANFLLSFSIEISRPSATRHVAGLCSENRLTRIIFSDVG
jgi:hypothetical protein